MQKTVVTKIDDLTEKPYEKGETITFGFEGKTYEIDLNALNARNFRRSMGKYMDRARKVRQSSRRHRVEVKHAHSEVAHVRQWAQENGVEVASRGRIPESVWEAYRASNGH